MSPKFFSCFIFLFYLFFLWHYTASSAFANVLRSSFAEHTINSPWKIFCNFNPSSFVYTYWLVYLLQLTNAWEVIDRHLILSSMEYNVISVFSAAPIIFFVFSFRGHDVLSTNHRLSIETWANNIRMSNSALNQISKLWKSRKTNRASEACRCCRSLNE